MLVIVEHIFCIVNYLIKGYSYIMEVLVMAKSNIGIIKNYQSEYEQLQRNLKGIPSDIRKAAYLQFYKKIAKAADQRMVNLESLAKKEGYKEVTEWAYAKAQRDIRGMFGQDAKRFNRKISPNENLNKIYKDINRVLDFLNAPTSSKQQIDEIFAKRANTIKEKYDVDMSWSKTATVFDTVLWKKTGARKASATALKAIGIIQKNKKQIKRALKENKPISIILPSDKDGKKDINLESTINHFLRYYKKDVKSLLKRD